MPSEGPEALLPDRSLQQRLSLSRIIVFFLSTEQPCAPWGAIPSSSFGKEGTWPVAERVLSEDMSIPVPSQAAKPGAAALLPRAQEVAFALECFKSLILILFWI